MGYSSLLETNGLITAPSIDTSPVSIGVYPYVVFMHTLVFILFCVYNRIHDDKEHYETTND